MGMLIAKFAGEQTHILSYKNVLVAHRFVGDFDVLKDAAKALGYEFILWNGTEKLFTLKSDDQ